MKKRLTINTLALGNLKQRRKQYTILIIGIILAIVFSSGTLFFISCMQSSQEEFRYRRNGKQDIIDVNALETDYSGAIANGAINGEIGYAHVLYYANSKEGKETDGMAAGWLDERGKELYYQRLMDGRFPEKSGEITVEKSALGRMKIEAEIGDKITLLANACNGADFLPEKTEMTFTLVGIFEDRRIFLEDLSGGGYQVAQYVPCAFVADGEQTILGGKENLVALIEINGHASQEAIGSLYNATSGFSALYTSYVSANIGSYGGGYSNISDSTVAFAFLSVLLTFASCAAIVNSFSNNLKERKNQIGMLRAVGATKRQIIKIFGRETFIISLISAPVSIALSYLIVKIFAVLMGENFIFIPNFTVLILGAVIGVICVMLASLIPLFGITKLSPMQAIRDIELMRKMKNKKIKSQSKFNVPNLLAKRNLTFSSSRRITVCLLLCITTIISCFSMSFLYSLEDEQTFTDYDYEIHNSGGYTENIFINSQSSDYPMKENQRQECLDLPPVKSVLGKKEGTINIIIDGEYPDYLRLNEYGYDVNSRFMSRFDPWAGMILTKENIEALMGTDTNPEYAYAKQVGGYTEEIFNSTLSAQSSELIKQLEDDIIHGKIDIDKLNSGEEIIVCAPDKIGYTSISYNGGYVFGLVNLSSDDELKDTSYNKEKIKSIVKTAENPFKVGDTLTLSFLYDDGTGKVTRTDRKVKIGAITGKKFYSDTFAVYTTLDGLKKLGGGNLAYDELGIMLKDEATAETDEVMQTQLRNILPDIYIISAFAVNKEEKQQLRFMALAIISLIVIFSCICISLINNSISSQIRYSKRAIGTLRAVGTSEKDLSKSYFLQVLNMVLWGFGIGIVLYIIIHYIVKFMSELDLYPLTLWPVLPIMAVLVPVCFINIKAKVKRVMKNSIVENIREL